MFRAASRAARWRIRRPFLAASVVEIAVTSGIASPSACGQATTSTVTTRSKINSADSPSAHHVIHVARAASIAMIVRRKAALSASICVLDLLVCASSTSFMMPASAVSSPTFVALIVSAPVVLIVPPITSLATVFFTAFDSPVSIASFISDEPLTTTPSTGTFAPGRTRRISPTLRSLTATVLVSPPSTTSSASSGSSLASSFSAPCAFSTDAISSQWPSSIIATSVASSHQKSMPLTTLKVTSKL